MDTSCTLKASQTFTNFQSIQSDNTSNITDNAYAGGSTATGYSRPDPDVITTMNDGRPEPAEYASYYQSIHGK